MEKFNKLYNNALKFLSFRSRSEKEAREYLLRHSGKSKMRPESIRQTQDRSDPGQVEDARKGTRMTTLIEQVIIKLKEQKFLNDYEFAKQWIESRSRLRPRSQKFLIFELKQKGISEEIIDSIIHPPAGGLFIIQNDLEQAKELVKKKIGKYKGLPKQEIFQKLGGFLTRRGFDYDTIKKAVDEALQKRV